MRAVRPDEALWRRTCAIPGVGTLVVIGTNVGVCAAAFDEPSALTRAQRRSRAPLSEDVSCAAADATMASLNAYANGDGNALSNVPIDVVGTPFQTEVWRVLREMSAGETTTYSAIARELGRPGAERAVGAANAINPVAVIVPCHRVIGRDGKLVGYAFGLERKRGLLVHEGALLA